MKIFLFQCKHVLALKRLINTTTYLFSLFNPPCRFPPSRVITRSFEHTNFPSDPSPWVRHSCSVVCDAARNRETARKLTARMHRLGSGRCPMRTDRFTSPARDNLVLLCEIIRARFAAPFIPKHSSDRRYRVSVKMSQRLSHRVISSSLSLLLFLPRLLLSSACLCISIQMHFAQNESTGARIARLPGAFGANTIPSGNCSRN